MTAADQAAGSVTPSAGQYAASRDGRAAAAWHDAEAESLNLAARPIAASQARQFTQRVLEGWQCPPEMIDASTLAVSELVTNAARSVNPHLDQQAGTSPDPPGCLALTLRRLPDRVVIEVSDDNPDPPVLADATTDAESGRGLLLVQEASECWGYRPAPAGGKVVFCVISTQAPKEPAD